MAIYVDLRNDDKTNLFLSIFNNFILDKQKYVRAAALEVLGQFVNLIERKERQPQFLEFYKNILDEYYFNCKEFGIETESNYYSNVIG